MGILQQADIRVQGSRHVSYHTGPTVLATRKALPWDDTTAYGAAVVSEGTVSNAAVPQEGIGALLPTAALQNLSSYARDLAHKVEGKLPASKEEVEAVNHKQDVIIADLVHQVQALTPVRTLLKQIRAPRQPYIYIHKPEASACEVGPAYI